MEWTTIRYKSFIFFLYFFRIVEYDILVKENTLS